MAYSKYAAAMKTTTKLKTLPGMNVSEAPDFLEGEAVGAAPVVLAAAATSEVVGEVIAAVVVLYDSSKRT